MIILFQTYKSRHLLYNKNMKKVLKIAIFVLLLLSSLFILNYFGIIRLPNVIITSISDTEVTITTDKKKYSIGEEISIMIKNNSNSIIYYDSLGDRKWGLEYLKEGEWVVLNNFQLTNQKI